jgi:hypothetical protein
MEEKNGALVFWLLFASKSNKGKRFERCQIFEKIYDLLFVLILFSRSLSQKRPADLFIEIGNLGFNLLQQFRSIITRIIKSKKKELG